MSNEQQEPVELQANAAPYESSAAAEQFLQLLARLIARAHCRRQLVDASESPADHSQADALPVVKPTDDCNADPS